MYVTFYLYNITGKGGMSRKYDRQMDLLNYLMQSGKTTIYRISCELGVCVHTVKRDIADLQYHFPIFTYAGRGGGVELNACYFVNNFMLSKDNVLLIKYSLQFLSFSDDERASCAQKLLYRLFHE